MSMNYLMYVHDFDSDLGQYLLNARIPKSKERTSSMPHGVLGG